MDMDENARMKKQRELDQKRKQLGDRAVLCLLEGKHLAEEQEIIQLSQEVDELIVSLMNASGDRP